MADQDEQLETPVPGTQIDPDPADLQASLAGIAGLITGAYSVEELLGQVAWFAAGAIPGAAGAGVTLWQPDHPEVALQTMAASSELVRHIDEIQYAVVDEGPCITAARERRTVRSGSLADDQTWPKFGPLVAALDVHSVLSLPLVVRERVVGAINIYAHERNAFDDRAAEMGQLFAAPAAVAVHNAQVLAAILASTEQMQKELNTRAIIDQAIGLVRARTGATADEVVAQLRYTSQQEHLALTAVAQRIIDQAVNRARAQRSAGARNR